MTDVETAERTIELFKKALPKLSPRGRENMENCIATMQKFIDEEKEKKKHV